MRQNLIRYPQAVDSLNVGCVGVLCCQALTPRTMQKTNVYQPGARYDHASCVFDDTKMMVFGGVGDGNTLFGDLWWDSEGCTMAG